jgi:phenylacetic acid degradation operon negative regulatory protein
MLTFLSLPLDLFFAQAGAMHGKSEEFLNTMLWVMDMFAHPTLRNLTGSYEEWAYRNGLFRQVYRLEKANLIARSGPTDERIYRVTNQGRLIALGGRDPEEHWARPWDRSWRLVVFDIPLGREDLRARFRRFLRSAGVGCLQKSVWISPHPLPALDVELSGTMGELKSLVVFEGRPAGGETDEQIVLAAWDFEKLYKLYSEHMKVLEQRPLAPLKDEAAAKAFRRWMAVEREAWLAAVQADPLLPDALLPDRYLGRKAWKARQQLVPKVTEQLRSFKAPKELVTKK